VKWYVAGARESRREVPRDGYSVGNLRERVLSGDLDLGDVAQMGRRMNSQLVERMGSGSRSYPPMVAGPGRQYYFVRPSRCCCCGTRDLNASDRHQLVHVGSVDAPIAALQGSHPGAGKRSSGGIEGLCKQCGLNDLKRLVDPLAFTLSEADGGARGMAAWLLGEIGDARAVDPLISVLDDTDRAARHSAVQALAKLGGQRAADAIESVLEDNDGQVRRGAERSEDADAQPVRGSQWLCRRWEQTGHRIGERIGAPVGTATAEAPRDTNLDIAAR
jgi:hypothetical protein